MILRITLPFMIAFVFIISLFAQTPPPTDYPILYPSPTDYPRPDYIANQMYSVSVPRSHILRGQQISSEMLTTVQMQGDFLSEIDTNPNGSIIADNTLIVGQYALCDLEPFAPINTFQVIEQMPPANTLSCGMIPRTIPRARFTTERIPLDVGARGSLFVEMIVNDGISLMLPVIFDAEIVTIEDELVTLLVPDSYRVTTLLYTLVENEVSFTLSPQAPNFKPDFFAFQGENGN